MSTADRITLKIPRQELDHGQFFASDPDAAGQWVDALPKANLGQMTRRLYEAIRELNRVRIVPAKRLAILNQLRPAIYAVSRGLGKHYLNKPIVLPEQARKVAELVHSLHQHLATGYTIVAVHSAALGRRASQLRPEQLIASAVHRALGDHTLNTLRHYQLYQPVKPGLWYTLHQLHALAELHRVDQQSINDVELGDSSIGSSYRRALLLGCSRPNQLRQEDFARLLPRLGHWADLCDIKPSAANCLFLIDPDRDQPPVYRELNDQAGPRARGLDTSALVEELQQLHSQAPEEYGIGAGDTLSPDLLGHLILAWGSLSRRHFIRLENGEHLNLCIGLSATHHYVSGEISFESLVEERGARAFTMQQDNPFLRARSSVQRAKDVWDSPYEAKHGDTQVAIESVDFHIRNNEMQQAGQEQRRYHSHQVNVINASANGYCIAWPEGSEAAIKTGEIVGLREGDSHNWRIATIRWVNHERADHTQLGLELLSPSASPYGARIVRRTGEPSDYARVLLLPEMEVARQPMTLLTPRVGFRSGGKVLLNQRGQEVLIKLGKKVNEFGAFHQFEFIRLNDQRPSNRPDNPTQDDEFDALWKNL